jgi:ABC-type Fe3+/spermidine/putrescine transport system ATPase subunit
MTLELRGIHYTYPGWPATLQGASMVVPDGTSAFLLGPSGSGKSTLLRLVAGLIPMQQGEVWLDGRRLDDVPPHRRRIGMLFQEPALFPHLKVWQNVAFGLRYRGVARRDERDEADRWLRLVQLDTKDEARVDQLSGGQRQRVALARTLAAKPRAVLLDEPLTGLDRALRDELGYSVKTLLAGEGVPALWVTHERDEALRLGDRVYELQDGACVPVAAT